MKLETLLVVIDASQPSHPALERAAWLARRSRARLHVPVSYTHLTLPTIYSV